MNGFVAAIKRYFISGVLVVVPLILTYLVLRFLFETIDNILRPVLVAWIGRDIPLIGVAALLVIILVAGVLVRSYLGHRVYSAGDRVIARLPLIRPVYSAAKQLLEALAGPSMQSFKDVALIEYPRRGGWALGFVANRIQVEIGDVTRQCAVVFVPSTPTPFSGNAVVLPLDEVYPVDMTIEEGVKYLVSGGVVSPALIREKPKTDSPSQNRGIVSETC